MDLFLARVPGALRLSLHQALFAAGPLLAAALLMHYQAAFIRARAAGLFGRDLFARLTAPGVIVHECGHLLFCLLFGHRLLEVSLFHPAPDGTRGRVRHAWNRRNPWQEAGNFFIATGPVWLAAGVILLLFRALAGPGYSFAAETGRTGFAAALHAAAGAVFAPGFHRDPRFYLYAWLIFSVGAHATLSPSDLRGAARGGFALLALLVLLNLVLQRPGAAGLVPETAAALCLPATGSLLTALLVNIVFTMPLLCLAGALKHLGH